MKNKRYYKVYNILINRAKHNLDVLFDFELSDTEFRNTYGATKNELKAIK